MTPLEAATAVENREHQDCRDLLECRECISIARAVLTAAIDAMTEYDCSALSGQDQAAMPTGMTTASFQAALKKAMGL